MRNITLLRMLRKKTQYELSMETRIPNYRISRLEAGVFEPTKDELDRLSEALGVEPKKLLADFPIERALELI